MTPSNGNPLLEPWQTPFGLPPFDRILPAHFVPAFEHALQAHRAEVDAIAELAEPPSFENTVAAFDRSGRDLVRIQGVFFNLTKSETSPALQAVEREMVPRLAAHHSAIRLHAKLFDRIDGAASSPRRARLAPEALRLLDRVHLDFVREGARLSGAARARHGEIVERLAALTTTLQPERAGRRGELSPGRCAARTISRGCPRGCARRRGRPGARAARATCP